MTKVLGIMLGVMLCGCDSYHFTSALLFERTGRHPRAAASYEKFLAHAGSDDSRVCEAHVRAAGLYARPFQRCLESRRHWEAAVRLCAASEPWFSRAKTGLLNCPDYFPLEPGNRWVYGDSESLGKNMRLDWEVKVLSPGANAIIWSSLFAGNRKVRERRTSYEKRDWAVWEYSGAQRIAVLKYPFARAQSWKARRDSSDYLYTIEANDARVVTAAGDFKDCLKVREFNKKFPSSWKYDYYAPFIGRVKTTVAGPGFENPNTELIKYELGDGSMVK